MTGDARRPDRPLLYAAAGIVALVAISAAVVLLLGGREPTAFPADSPEGTVQRHLQTRSALAGMMEQIEGVSTEEVAAQILALQVRLQASLQTTSLMFETSLVNYI